MIRCRRAVQRQLTSALISAFSDLLWNDCTANPNASPNGYKKAPPVMPAALGGDSYSRRGTYFLSFFFWNALCPAFCASPICARSFSASALLLALNAASSFSVRATNSFIFAW